MHPSDEQSSARIAPREEDNSTSSPPLTPLQQHRSQQQQHPRLQESLHSHQPSRATKTSQKRANRKNKGIPDHEPTTLPPWLYHSHPAYLHEFHHHYLPQVKPPVPPPKDPAYLEALRIFHESGSRSQFHLHGGVIGSGGEHGVVGHSKRRDLTRSTTGKSASNNNNNNIKNDNATTGGAGGAGGRGRGRRGLEKLRSANRAFLDKLQSVKQMSLWPSSKHFCWSSIATASDPSPLTSHMHAQYMQHQLQQQQQQEGRGEEEEKQQQQVPGKKDATEKTRKQKRRSFFPSLNSKRTRRPEHPHADVDAVAASSPAPAATTTTTTTATPTPPPPPPPPSATTTTATTSPSVVAPSHANTHASTNGNNNNITTTTTTTTTNDNNNNTQAHSPSPSHLLAAGAAAGTGGGGVVTAGGLTEAGATPSSASDSLLPLSRRSLRYEYPQYQEPMQAQTPPPPPPPPSKSSASALAVTRTTAAAAAASSSLSSPPHLLPVLVTGPEHWYHLALQLESSALLTHQLQAKELFTRSAELGFAPAQFKLGICFELELLHCPMDPSQSFHWYRQAALQGHADAELAISGWYLTGHSQGLGQSDALAYEWAHKAALRGWSKAEYTLGHYHEVGIGVAPDLGLAQQWYLKAASRGNERALLRLLVGHVGLEVDYAHLKDALLALNHTNPYLIHQLAHFHEARDYGLVPDDETAFELYVASAQADYAPAQYKLGACYEFGILSTPRDPVQAVEWYRRGAENGHVEALLALAGFFLDGSAGPAAPQSDEDAFRYVRMAALRGAPKAEYIAGFFLEYGLGNARHVEQAKQWYRLACAKGVESAERRLRVLEREAGR
ncbi:hypothetical protein DFQ27_005207 [Actinomortierella ambigua]|uniref:HCP-like protein n=1 Tax=Actinomortierella ambigua TaxID=1343610 RepID=A0A9P6U2X0_9FUNG|nr:hypothetical protein DFQ27_005207 [Actinomortierella ambigua]